MQTVLSAYDVLTWGSAQNTECRSQCYISHLILLKATRFFLSMTLSTYLRVINKSLCIFSPILNMLNLYCNLDHQGLFLVFSFFKCEILKTKIFIFFYSCSIQVTIYFLFEILKSLLICNTSQEKYMHLCPSGCHVRNFI